MSYDPDKPDDKDNPLDVQPYEDAKNNVMYNDEKRDVESRWTSITYFAPCTFE